MSTHCCQNTKLTTRCHFSSSVVGLHLAEDRQDKTKPNLHCLESCPSHDQSQIFFLHLCHAIPTYWYHIWKSIVGEAPELLKEAISRCFTLHGIYMEMIQDIKCECRSWTNSARRK